MSDEKPPEIALVPEVVKTRKEKYLAKRANEMVTTAKGLAELENRLTKAFPTESIVKYVKDLCEAEDVKLTKEGVEIKSPNWEARKNGLDRVLNLLRFTNKDNTSNTGIAPSRIIFNIVNQAGPAEKK